MVRFFLYLTGPADSGRRTSLPVHRICFDPPCIVSDRNKSRAGGSFLWRRHSAIPYIFTF